jgi:beta-glucosidase
VAWTQQAVALAKSADAVILNVGNSGNAEREGRDRIQGLLLSAAQENLINAVTKANPKTAVVTFTAGVGMEHWIQNAPAVLQAMYPGEQGGKAIAELLFGAANPSGKLTVSIPKSEDQYPKGHWVNTEPSINYSEGVFVGYRYFDEHKIDPQFPFGHGLSYTTFKYGEPKLSQATVKSGDTVTVTLDIANTGNRAGAEVVQLYVHEDQCSVPRPPKELKAFKKIFLKPGETQTVTLTLDKRSFAYFSETQNDWVIEPGKFQFLIGSSSRDIRQTATCEVN